MGDILEYLSQREILAALREELQDSVALVPSNIDLIRTDSVCEEWSVTTQIGAIPLIFYYNGIVVLNTAPYDGDTLAWITHKAKLMEIKNAIDAAS